MGAEERARRMPEEERGGKRMCQAVIQSGNARRQTAGVVSEGSAADSTNHNRHLEGWGGTDEPQ